MPFIYVYILNALCPGLLTVGTVESTRIDCHCFLSTMKDSVPSYAAIFIIGTFTTVCSAKGDDINFQPKQKNTDYMKIHSPPRFDYIIQENSEETLPVLDNGAGSSLDKAGHNRENTEANKMNRNVGYINDLRMPKYGYNIRSNLIVLQSRPQGPQFYRSDIDYSSKSPIQILPSRFPPPIEKLIQNIQNYFSTYNHPDLQNRPFLPQKPQVTPAIVHQSSTSDYSTEAVTEVTEEITTEEGTEENTVTAVTTT